MEEILSSVSTPFSTTNFRKLLELYLKAEYEHDFYYQVVTYHKDKELSEDKKRVTVNDLDLEKNDHIIFFYPSSGWNVMTYMGHIFRADHRIYINAPYDKAKEILNYFVSRCIEEKLPFDSKFPDTVENFNRNDSIVISSNSSVYERHIEILRELARERPDIAQACGTPHLLSGAIDGWLGLSDECNKRFTSPSMQIMKCILEALVVFLKNNPKILETLGDEKLINKIKNDGIVIPSDIDFEIKKKFLVLVQEHPEIYEEIYNNFLDCCEIKGLRRENPIFYKETPEILMDRNQTAKKRLTVDLENLLLRADATDILMLLLDERLNAQLDISGKVKMIERMVSIHMKDLILQTALLCNMQILIDKGLISDGLVCKLEDVYGYDSRYKEWDYFENVQDGGILDCIMGRRYKFNGQPKNEDALLEYVESAELPDEQKKIKIQETLIQMRNYCESMRVDKEKMKQRLECLEKIYAGSFQFYYINVDDLLREEIAITKFRFEHAKEINEMYDQIIMEIDSLLEQLKFTKVQRTTRNAQSSDINDDDEGEIDD